MQVFQIEGGTPLEGEVVISGAKNAVLPLQAAALLADGKMTIRNVPRLKDVATLALLLEGMGVTVKIDKDNNITTDTSTIKNQIAPYELVRTMRASILVLGPLVARYGYAEVSLPGGCAIGSRPVNIHLSGLEAMGVEITVDEGFIRAKADKLIGATIIMEAVTVTGTENLLMAAVLAEGTTVLENAAREPEVVDLANCLIGMGAKISGAGTNTITVTGVKKLKGIDYSVLPDRIETGTYLAAAAITGGRVKCVNAAPETLDAVMQKFRECGASVEIGKDWIELDMRGRKLKAVDIRTEPHPAFPTDMQAQFMALAVMAKGESLIEERLFENRFMHVSELNRLGADIWLKGSTAAVKGVEQLYGADVMATDLRASSALVLAALAAKGTTNVRRIYHLDRGYDDLEGKLSALGADIVRKKES